MPQIPNACVADDGPCDDTPVIARPVVLCRVHLAAVAHQALTLFVAPEAKPFLEATADDEAIRRAKPMNIADSLTGAHPSAVYFIANGDRVKIGFTTNLKSRVATLSLRESDVLLLLRGEMDLERALHRRFAKERINNTEWFACSTRIRRFMTDKTAPAVPVAAPPRDLGSLYYPDGKPVGRDEWPALWQAFERMGSATKAELQNAGVVSSRDTVRRALEVWAAHGVLHRRDGMSIRYYLPGREEQSA